MRPIRAIVLVAMAATQLVASSSQMSAYTAIPFADWSDVKDADIRAVYIRGALDMFFEMTFLYPGMPHGWFLACLEGSGLSTTQLADRIKAYGDSQPRLATRPMSLLIIDYFLGLCGDKPP